MDLEIPFTGGGEMEALLRVRSGELDMVSVTTYVAGALLFFLSGLFDEMDGMLARIKLADSPFGTYLESHADSLSYLLLFGGISIGLYRQHGPWVLWTGGLLLIGAALALTVTTLQRKRKRFGLA